DKVTQDRLCRVCNNLGLLQGALGENKAALASHQRALGLRLKLGGPNPDMETRSEVATTLINIANLQRRTGSPQDALRTYQEALALQDRLVQENSARAEFRSVQAAILNNLGVLQLEQFGQAEDALRSYEKALALRQELRRADPVSLE